MNSQSISDATLVSQYIQGDEPSLSILIKRHQQRLYSFIYSKVYDRDVTEDVFQDTFIKVIRTLKRGNYNEEGKFLPVFKTTKPIKNYLDSLSFEII